MTCFQSVWGFNLAGGITLRARHGSPQLGALSYAATGSATAWKALGRRWSGETQGLRSPPDPHTLQRSPGQTSMLPTGLLHSAHCTFHSDGAARSQHGSPLARTALCRPRPATRAGTPTSLSSSNQWSSLCALSHNVETRKMCFQDTFVIYFYIDTSQKPPYEIMKTFLCTFMYYFSKFQFPWPGYYCAIYILLISEGNAIQNAKITYSHI